MMDDKDEESATIASPHGGKAAMGQSPAEAPSVPQDALSGDQSTVDVSGNGADVKESPNSPPTDGQIADKTEDETPSTSYQEDSLEAGMIAPSPPQDAVANLNKATSENSHDSAAEQGTEGITKSTSVVAAPVRSQDIEESALEADVTASAPIVPEASHAMNVTSQKTKNEPYKETQPKNSVITIQHNVETTPQPTSRSGLAIFSSLSRPMTAVMILFALGGVATWGYFFSQFLRIPGLEDQVDRLEAEVDELEKQVEKLETQVELLKIQVDRLTLQVDRLEEENDRFEELNNALTAANEEFATLIMELNESNSKFQEQTMQLNASVTELQDQNDQLSASNEEFRSLNEELNSTNTALATEIGTLTVLNQNLTNTNGDLIEQNVALLNETNSLRNLTVELNETVNSLEDQLSSIQDQNDELRLLVNDLNTIVSFLEEEAADGDETYQELASFLAEQITVNRALLLGVTQNTFTQTLTSWDCNLFDTFAGDPFIEDLDSPIGATDYPSVIAEVESLALTPLCLDLVDFELYLNEQVAQSGNPPPVDTSMNELVRGVNMYSTAALNYYFPDADDAQGGLTQEDWVAADYVCSNFPDDLRFMFQ